MVMIFFDIDGTLLDHDMRLPASTKQAVMDLKSLGHEVAIATGRAPFMFEDLRKELEIDSFICLNGQVVVLKGKVIYRNPLNTNLLRSLTDYAIARDHPIVYMDLNQMKMNVSNNVHIESSMRSLNIALPKHDPEYYLNNEIYQAMIFCQPEDEESYRQSFKRLKFIRWHPISMDILPGNGSKANGISQIMMKLGIDKAEVYAFGDNYNDIEMFKFVGHSVSMGNAPDIVKQSARYITKNVDEDGILFGLKLVGLL
jgi:Cof subfamily protein (haloacid dehalogenase superfamily)